MRASRWAVLTVAVLVAGTAGGCSGLDEAEAAPAGTAQTAIESPSQPSAPELDTSDDPGTCAAFGDVLTIVENADIGLADGRMEPQEHQGWYQLATRVLGRLPAAGDGAVPTAVARLQEIAPAVPSGGVHEPAGVRTPEWYDAMDELSAACDDLGVPLAISMFTGG